MAHSKSAEKRVRQNEKCRIHNKSVRSGVKTQVKKFAAAVSAGDEETANAEYKRAVSAVDRATKHGIYHPNNAARQKSRLSKMLSTLQQKPD